ncbi:MAG TPA: signal peptidase I [Nocardioidaceae bacterium]|nr:signal peptidase I [Nocardioidaceae bacterium]
MSMNERHSTADRVLSGLVNLASVLVVLGAVAFLAPSLMGYERYVIVGDSMSGTFDRGSVAFEKPVPVGDLEVGDVITYMPPAESGLSNLVTHRIKAIRRTSDGATVFRTQGDANADPDPWKFQLDALTQPRLEMTVPYVGNLFIALADRSIRIYVVGIPAGLIAAFSLVELVRALRPRRAARPSLGV